MGELVNVTLDSIDPIVNSKSFKQDDGKSVYHNRYLLQQYQHGISELFTFKAGDREPIAKYVRTFEQFEGTIIGLDSVARVMH